MQRIIRLRELFLDESRGPQPLGDYWRQVADLQAYDEVLGARIGWKWFEQVVCAPHSSAPDSHSSMSVQSKPLPVKPSRQSQSGARPSRFVHVAKNEHG